MTAQTSTTEPAKEAAPAAQASAVLPKVKTDWPPLLITPAIILLSMPLVGNFPTWATLTVAGLAMGMMTFVMASGLTLIFGLMDVLTFAHGAFVAFGAYMATVVLFPMAGWVQADSVALNLLALVIAIVVAMVSSGVVGLFFERVIIRPVYGLHTKQILITMGAMVVAEQLIIVFWGANQLTVDLPATFKGSYLIGEATFEKYRVLVMLFGLALFGIMYLVLNRTKLGLLIRAGVQNPEMVEALGYRIRRIFIGVFITGSALAGLGGVLWSLYRTELTTSIGAERTIDIFIVIIIGGLGSIGGCFVGSILAALLFNYTSYFAPSVASLSEVLLMVIVLMWRPQGLFPVSKR